MRFNQEELVKISKAVIEAEKKTSGEIIPYLVLRSGRYEHAALRAFLFVFFALIGFCYALPYVDVDLEVLTSFSWFFSFEKVFLVSLVIGGIAGGITCFVPSWTHFFASEKKMASLCDKRAAEAFIAEEVFDTQDRTGILLFVSLLEHRVIVMGDKGINAKVTPEAWDDIVKIILTGIQNGDVAGGFSRGIEASGHLLKRCGVTRNPEDINEHSDGLRFYEE